MYWRSRPAVLARRFVEAINAGDYSLADALFVDRKHQFVVAFMDSYPGNEISAAHTDQSLGDWLRGESFVELTTENDNRPWEINNNSMRKGYGGLQRRVTVVRRLSATASGLHSPDDFFNRGS
jgi:hypothetical protein